MRTTQIRSRMKNTPVNENKTTAEALRESEARIRAILDTTVDGIVTIDESGLIQDFNRAAEQLFGFAADEVIGRNVKLLMPTRYAENHDSYIADYLRTGQAKIIGIGREVEGKRKDGSTFPLEIAISEVDLIGRKLFTGILRDITRRKNAEEALLESKQFLQAIIDTEPECVKLVDRDGTLLMMNHSGLEMIEATTLEEVLGTCMYPLITQEYREKFQSLIESVFRGQSGKLEFDVIGRKGTRRTLETHAVPLRNAAGEITSSLGITRDITGRRRAEEAIVSVSEAERRIIGQDLHDVLGQQLTGIALLSKALARDLEQKAAGHVEDATGIADMAQQAVTEARRLAHGLYPTGIDHVGLPAALTQMADTQERLYHVSCTFEGDSQVPHFEHSVSMHLYRIVQEAVNNAIKHAQCRHIWIRLARDGRDVTLSVADDGIGLPNALPQGEGMGLEIMKYRTRMIGGNLDVLKRPEGGTIIGCRLSAASANVNETET